mgnify:CR=1 FL=1
MTAVKTGLSRKLLARVLSVYFSLTLLVTVGQIFTEYLSTKNHVEGELQTLKNTFSSSLTRALWELNHDQVRAIAEGLMSLPIVEGLQVRGENGNYIAEYGIRAQRSPAPVDGEIIEDHPGGLFSYSFPLVFKFSGRESTVGDVTLYSSFDTIFSRIEVGLFFLIGNAIIKTAFLVFLFMSAFRTMLTNPLHELRQQISDFDINDLESSKLHLNVTEKNEFTVLEQAYNSLVDGMVDFQKRLNGTQAELREAAGRGLHAVARELLAELAKHLLAVVVARHVDEVDDDDAAEIAQPQLARDGGRRLEIGLEDGLFEVAMADETPSVDVDGSHRLGLVDHQIATTLELHLAAHRLVQLILDTEQIEDRSLAGVILDAPFHVGHELAGEFLEPDEVLARVDAHALDLVTHHVAQRAHEQRQIIIDHAGHGGGQASLADLAPQAQQEVHVLLELGLADAFGRRAQNETAGGFRIQRRQALLGELLEAVTLGIALDALRHAGMRRVRHVDQIA